MVRRLVHENSMEMSRTRRQYDQMELDCKKDWLKERKEYKQKEDKQEEELKKRKAELDKREAELDLDQREEELDQRDEQQQEVLNFHFQCQLSVKKYTSVDVVTIFLAAYTVDQDRRRASSRDVLSVSVPNSIHLFLF